MPKPPMKDDITVLQPILSNGGKPIKDDYGRPKFKDVPSKARIQHTTKIVRNSNGQEVQALLSIDLPQSVKVDYGYEIKWINRFDELVRGRVLSINETLNYTGNKVYFRSVNIG
jgi:hypothetical protein